MDLLSKIKKKVHMDAGNSTSFAALGFFILINIIAGFVFGAILYFINVKGKNVSSLVQELKIETQKEDSLKTMKKVLVSTVSLRQKLDEYFVHSDDIIFLLQDIEDLGVRTGVKVSFETVNVKDGNGLNQELSLRISTEGDFADTFYMLSLLELLPFKLSFEQVFMEKQRVGGISDKTSESIWKGVFLITILSYLEEPRFNQESRD